MYSSKTNLEGNGSFKIPKELIYDSSHIFYYVSSYLDDSLNNGGYSGGILVYNAGRTNNNLIEVNTLCGINFNSISSIWDYIKIDYIAIHHKNYYPQNLYNQWQTVELEADCANSNTLNIIIIQTV